MRVLQVVLTLGPGGSERLVIELTRRLHPSVATTVCCLDEPGSWAHEVRELGIEVIGLGRRPGFRPALGQRIASIAREVSASVLHCHHYSPFVYGCLAAARERALRFIFTAHGEVDVPDTFRRRAGNWLCLRARTPDRSFAVSSHLRDRLLASGFPKASLEVLHNGVDAGAETTPRDRAAARAALGLRAGEFVFGTVARLDPVKDLPSLVAAFARVRGAVPGARLVVVGDGPDRDRITAEAERHSLDGSVLLAGLRSHARRLLPAFDVYVNSSTSEGVSITILEAMAASLPVVATRVGGNPEVVEEGRTGLLVPPVAPDALAAAMSALASDATRRLAMARAARERVSTRFTLDRMVAGYVEAYEGQAAAPRRGLAPRGAA